MSLKIESGDAFNALYHLNEAGQGAIFVHGCNAKGVMGSGVASLVKKLYPFAFDQYRAEHKDFGLVLGDVVFATDEDSKVVVANAITQENFGRDGKLYVNYDAVVDSMGLVSKYAKANNLPIVMVMVGGGLGGGDTKRLTAIFQAVFHDVDATLYLKED